MKPKNWISSQLQSRAAILKHTRYRFDETFQESGRAKSVLYVAFNTVSNQVMCAKSFLAENAEDAKREFDVSFRIHSTFRAPSLIRISESIDVGHSRQALMMPLLARSLSAFLLTPKPFPDHSIFLCAFSLIASLEVLHDPSINLCYADWKPANICLPGFVTIDYGAVVPNGQAITEYTPPYPLDAPPIGNLRWDLNCAASTLFPLVFGFPHSFKTRTEFSQFVSNQLQTQPIRLIRLLLSDVALGVLWDAAVRIVQPSAQIRAEFERLRATKLAEVEPSFNEW